MKVEFNLLELENFEKFISGDSITDLFFISESKN